MRAERGDELYDEYTPGQYVELAIARFGMSLLEAERLTPYEYHRYSRAFDIRQEDRWSLLARLAFDREVVQSERKVGKNYVRVFQNFQDYYNYEEALDRIFNSDVYILEEDAKSIERKQKAQSSMEMNSILNRIRNRKQV